MASLQKGFHFGHFEILSPLGAGGMGEVYRARDTRLDRTVAIKVLAGHLADRADVRERFEREARAIAGLNHPHICVLYDVGHQDDIDYLVMEYLEGETLAQRLAKGPLPIPQMLRYAVQIADALEKAHRNGITHRDLKPSNIMLTRNGAKLLDFGLAKLKQEAMPATLMSQLPTMHTAATTAGSIVGTVQYMAPEQLEAKEVDPRTDIFAFGLVVYEMATGRRAFEGKTTASVMAKILESEPAAISSVQPMTPRDLDRVVKACLAKDPDERWQSAADLKRELKWIEAASQLETSGIQLSPASASTARVAAATKTKREWLLWVVSSVLFVAASVLAAIHFTEKRPVVPPTLQFQVGLPDKVSFTRTSALALSPDGRNVAFAAVGAENIAHIWVQGLDGEPARALTNTDIGMNMPPPFWSPDGRFIVYSGFTKIRKVDLSSGMVQDICDKPGLIGGSWNGDGVIIFGGNTTGLWKTTVAGGKAFPLTVLDTSWHEREHELPQFLPDGRHFLYLRVSDQADRTGVYVGSIDDPPERQSKKRILDTAFGVTFIPSPAGKAGTLLSFRDGTVTAQGFDPKTLQFQDEPVTVAERVGAAFETPEFAASSNLIVYRTMAPHTPYQLTWIDDEGKPGGTVGDALDDISLPVLSPDGTRIVFGRNSGPSANRDIWVLDATRGVNMRFTFGMGDNTFPSWSPDGREVVFSSNRDGGGYSLYRKPANGSQPEQLLLKSDSNAFVTGWSPDGQFIVYQTRPVSGPSSQLWTLSLRENVKPIPIFSSKFDEVTARISPDRRWLAYASNETGRYEVYVREFTPAAKAGAAGGKWLVSRDGGYWPMWRKDGKELRYISSVDQNTVMSVSVDSDHSFQAGVPQTVSRLPSERSKVGIMGLANVAYSSDLKHLLVPMPVEQTLAPVFGVIVNWASGSKAK